MAKPPLDKFENEFWPYQRYGHTVVSYGKKIYLFGGRNDNHSCNRLYCFDTDTHKWSCPDVCGYIPAARQVSKSNCFKNSNLKLNILTFFSFFFICRDGHSACVVNDAMYVFGGYDDSVQDDHERPVQVFRLCLKQFEWTLVRCRGNLPLYRDFHTATAIGDKMFIFGGRSDSLNAAYNRLEEYYSDQLVYLDLSSNEWIEPNILGCRPRGRRSHSAVNLDGNLLIFGGFNGNTKEHMNDMWLLDTCTWTWRQIQPHGEGPEPRRRQALCQVGRQLFLFGGTSPHYGLQIYFTPEQQSFMPDHQPSNLIDHNDMYVLDLAPSLRSLCIDYVNRHSHLFDMNCLPKSIRFDIDNMTVANEISKPLQFRVLPVG